MSRYARDPVSGSILPVAGGGSGGHTILDEDGVTYPQRSKLQFEGCEVTDDSTNDITKIKAEGGVTGVKGNAETDYRTGNVNLTPAHVGAVDEVDYEEDIYGVETPNPQSIQHQLTDQTNVLGAKNRFHSLVKTNTYLGIRYSSNGDEVFTLNGTASSSGNSGNIVSNSTELTNLRGKYIISVNVISGSSTKYTSIAFRKSTSSFWEIRNLHSNVGKTLTMEVDLSDNEHFDGWGQIYVQSEAVCTNLKFNVMIYSASIPDNTFVPYAMTNRELTEKAKTIDLKSSLSQFYILKTENMNRIDMQYYLATPVTIGDNTIRLIQFVLNFGAGRLQLEGQTTSGTWVTFGTFSKDT